MGVFTQRSTYIAGSFKGIPFEDTTVGSEHGMRNQVHEFFNRDAPYDEVMGRKARVFHVEGKFCGDDHVRQKMAFALACETGPGPLHHRTYGIVVVNCDQISFDDSRSEERLTRFSASFIEAGALSFPGIFGDFRSGLRGVIEVGMGMIFSAFATRDVEEGKTTKGIKDGFVVDYHRFVLETADKTGTAYQKSYFYSGTDPNEAFQLGYDSSKDPLASVARLQKFRDWNLSPVNSLNALDAQTAGAYSRYVRGSAALTSARLTIDATLKNRNQAEFTLDQVYGFLNEEADRSANAYDDDSRKALRDAAVAVQKNVALQIDALPDLITTDFKVYVPSIVASYKIYRDPERRSELEKGNRPIHPLWMNRCVESSQKAT